MKTLLIAPSVLLCLTLVHQDAVALSCDPDDFAAGSNMFTSCTGVTLRTQYGDPATSRWNSVFSQYQRIGDPVTASSINASTGDQVFSWFNPADTPSPSTWNSGMSSQGGYRHLLATFTFPTNYVSIDFIPAREGYIVINTATGEKLWLDRGVLYVYNTSGVLIKTVNVPNETPTRVTRVQVFGNDIGSIRAGGWGPTGGNLVALDHLVFNTPSNQNIDLSGGYLDVSDATASLGPGASMTGSGTVGGNLSNSGTVSPGDSPGRIGIAGNYTQTSSGILKMEIGGIIPDTGYDVLAVTGNAMFGGLLDIDLGNFIPQDNQTFDLVSFGTRSGDFAQVMDLTFQGGHFDWAWLDHSLRLTAQLDTIAPPNPGAVPEPATLALLGLGLAGLGFSRRKQ